MTLHYHGTPVNPVALLEQLYGCHFTVSFYDPRQVDRCHRIGQSVMLDNGAFSLWRSGTPTDWPGFYRWCDRWLDYPTTWAVIPDVIEGDPEDQESLIAEWPFGNRGAPVWHLHEPLSRLLGLLDEWPRVCFGSSGHYAEVLSTAWCRRIDAAWNEIVKRHRRTPWIHMLRGMQCSKREWPFASIDSTDIARNHNRPQNEPVDMARRWDREQCPPVWVPREQLALEELPA
jgi:hypothetical protein